MFDTLTSAFTFSRVRHLMAAALIAVVGAATPLANAATADAKGKPDDFVLAVGTNALDAVKTEQSIKAGDLTKINQVVNDHILPYTNLEKTTRLATGRHWRQASPEQQQALVKAFTGTLIRTYSGAFTKVDQQSKLNMLPFRGDAAADDVVVRSTLSQGNGPAVGIDYRLEKTPEGWRIYDLNVEGIWLIQNYRNQFSQQISQNGIDGLISALNQRNQ